MLYRERTILFTEACPLECRYCNLKASETFATNPTFTLEHILNRIEEYYLQDVADGARTEILFTGGEPFLFWNYIKTVIDKYGNNLSYKFNTSGYLLTKEILEYLSHYDVSFCLSCDGDETLTNWLRPNKDNKYRVGYMKKARQIFPYLLYYFPKTPFRIIIGPRYIDKLYDIYLYAERLGFKYFTFILDFNSRPYDCEKLIYYRPWNNDDTEKLTQQCQKICMEIIEGWRQGVNRMQVVEFNDMIQFFMTHSKFDINNFPCRLFDGRSNDSLESDDATTGTFCFVDYFKDLDAVKMAMQTEYNNLNGQCEKDPNCECFNFCISKGCPKDNYTQHNKFFEIEALRCALNKACFNAIMPMLMTANILCKGSYYYEEYLKERSQ